jgi:hypothetical protein
MPKALDEKWAPDTTLALVEQNQHLFKGSQLMSNQSSIEENSKHAVFSPSAAKRWINCPGSINACEDLPKQKPNFYSAEGTVAHEIGAAILSLEVFSLATRTTALKDGFEIAITNEMMAAVLIYTDFVKEQIARYDEQPEIERKVKVTEDCYGTADSVIYSPYRILIINDYKHGAGIQVDAEMNEQMMIYAMGKLLELTCDERDEIPIVQMNIVQPRGAGEAIKTFEMKTDDLIHWFSETLLPAIDAAKQPDAPLNPGDWCKYCPAALTCPALKKENLAVAKIAFDTPVLGMLDRNGKPKEIQWVNVLTPKAIADLLDKESMVMSFYKRLNEHAAELASKNTKIPGYTYQKKFGNRKWKEGAEKELYKNGLWQSLIYDDPKLKSPTQVEKILKANKLPFDLNAFVEKPFTGYALKKANGKEITVKEVFSEIE